MISDEYILTKYLFMTIYHPIFSELVYLLCHRMLYKFIYMLNRYGQHNIYLAIMQRSSLCHVTYGGDPMTHVDWFKNPTVL